MGGVFSADILPDRCAGGWDYINGPDMITESNGAQVTQES